MGLTLAMKGALLFIGRRAQAMRRWAYEVAAGFLGCMARAVDVGVDVDVDASLSLLLLSRLPWQNNEKFVPNPHHTSPLALSMLRFVGRLMGLSLRTRLCLPFQFPSMIWKRMLVSP